MPANTQPSGFSQESELVCAQGETGLPASLDVAALSRKIMGGDHAAFTTFYHAFFMRLYRYLLVCSQGRESLVQEAVQETMLRIIKHIKPFSTEKDLWAWVCCVARSALVDLLRKEQRHQQHLAIQTPVEQGIDSDLQEHLRHCLDQLDVQDGALIEGKYYQAQTYETLAVKYRMTPKAVESRLARIRKKLKALLLKRLNHESIPQ